MGQIVRIMIANDGAGKVSSYCSGGNCIGIKHQDGAIHVTDTKSGDSLSFSVSEWLAFTQGVKANEFDLAELA